MRTMILVILTAFAVLCGADKLDSVSRGYLPPLTAKTAGGSPGALQTPFEGLPPGSYTNDALGVVVDAANPGTRTSGAEPTGLGGPRASYGSSDSKVGDAAFTGSVGFGGSNGPNTRIAPGFNSVFEGSQSDKTRASTLKFANDLSSDKYSFGYETDNGIAVGEDGVAADGSVAQGGYSYKGDDGKVYKVTYTADKGGYKPQGQHLPTPPPIPSEILVSLEKNAKEEAAGITDDGSYNAQKYNTEGDYNNDDENGSNRPINGDTTASGSFAINQASIDQGFGFKYTSNSGSHSLGGSGSSSSSGQFGQATGSNGHFGQQANHGSSVHAHSTQSQFGVRSEIPESTQVAGTSGAFHTGIQSTDVQRQVSPGFTGTPNSRSDSNSAFSSAVVTGSGSASAYASSGPSGKFDSTRRFTESESSTGASYSDYTTARPSSAFGGNSQKYGGSQNAAAFNSGRPSIGAPSFGSLTSGQNQFGSVQNGQSNQVGASNEYLPPGTISGSTLVSGNQENVPQNNQNINTGSSSFQSQTFNSKPGQYNQGSGSFSSSSGQAQIGNTYSNVKPTQPSFGVSSIPGQGPTKVPDSELTTPFVTSSFGSTGSSFNSQLSNQQPSSFNNVSPTPTQPSFASPSFQSPQPVSSFQSQYKPQSVSTDTNVASSTQKPSLTQQQGADSSYYYNPPSKPFNSPSPGSNVPFNQFSDSSSSQSTQYSINNRQPSILTISQSQQGSKYSNNGIGSTEAPTSTGQYQTTSSPSYNGITLASVSPFGSGSPTPATQFGSQFSQFGTKPTKTSTQFSQSTSSQFGVIGSQQNFNQKPSTQLGLSQSQSNSQSLSNSQGSDSQEYQGTLYEYNKPAESLPAPAPSVGSLTSGQSSTFNSGSQGQTTQFNQKPIVSSQPSSSFQQAQFGTDSRFGQKPGTQASNLNAFGSSHTGPVYQQNKFGSTQGSSFTSGSTQTAQFGKKPYGSQSSSTFQQSQFGSSESQFNQKPSLNQGSTSTLVQPGQLSFAQKPFSNSQTGSSLQDNKFGASGSQFIQKPQTQGTSFASQTSQFGSQNTYGTTNKPFSSFQTTTPGYQQSQYVSQSGQTPQTAQGSSFSSIAGLAQSSQFGSQNSYSTTTKKPFGSSYFGNQQPGSLFNQNKQTAQGSSIGSGTGSNSQSVSTPQLTSQNAFSTTTQKPFGSFSSGYQQSQFGSSGSLFNQNKQTAQGSSFGFGTGSHGQSVSTPQLTSQNSYSTTTQKPFSSSSSGYQQQQFGSTGSLFNKNKQTAQGSSFGFGSGSNGQSVSTPQLTSQNSYSTTTQKPFSSSSSGYQQQQFGSTGSLFNKNKQTAQGSSFGFGSGSNGQSVSTPQLTSQNSYSTTTQKPFSSSSSGYQQQQFGSTGSLFNKNKQTAQGSSFGFGAGSNGQSVSTPQLTSQNSYSTTTQKPFGSYSAGYQQPQIGSSGSLFNKNKQTAQGSSFGFGAGSNGQSVSTPQFTSQNSYSTTTQKPFGSFSSGYQQSQFDSSGSKFGTQTSQGSSLGTGSNGQTTQFGKKPFGSSPSTGAVIETTQFGLTNSQFGQKPTTQISSFDSKEQATSTSFVQKPIESSQSPSTFASTGSQFGQNIQNNQGSSFSTGTDSNNQPTGFSQTNNFNYQQGQYYSSGSESGKPQSYVGTSSSVTQNKYGQASQFGQKPFGSSQGNSNFQQSQTGLAGSQLEQKPQTGFGSTATSQFNKQTQSSQFGVQPFGSENTQGSYQQTTNLQTQPGQTTFGQKFGSSQTGSNFQQTQFGSKPFGTSQTGSSFQTTQFGSESKFGQKPQLTQSSGTSFSSSSQTYQSQFGSQSNKGSQFGSSTSFDRKPLASATAFSSSTGSNIANSGSKYQEPQAFGTAGSLTDTTQGALTQSSNNFGAQLSQGSQTSFGNQNSLIATAKPFGSPSSYGTTQKPIGSQSAFQQSQFTSPGQKPSSGIDSSQGASVLSQSIRPQGDSKSPSSQSGLATQFGSQSTSQLSSIGNTDASGYSYQKPQQPFNTGSSSSQLTGQSFGSFGNGLGFEQTQSTVGPFQSGPEVSTTARPQFGSQSFKPASTASSVSQSSQFGAQPTQQTGVTDFSQQFSGQPFKPASTASSGGSFQYGSDSSVQPTQSAIVTTQRPSQSFSASTLSSGFSTTVTPNRFGGSYDGPVVSTIQTPVVPISTIDDNSRGEHFGGPRDPPKFDNTGYHY